MVRPRPLLLFSVLIFYSAFGDSTNVGKSEITEDFKKGDSRKDAEQDPYTSVTLAAQAGDAPSKLFSTCIAASQTAFEARFASIEVVPGSEYIRYVPDSRLSSFPIPWEITTGNYASILDCARAAHAGGWPMFKYNGSTCEVVNTTFSLSDVPACGETASDAVFILSTAAIGDCPIPRFLVGYEDSGAPVCGLVSTDLMTYDEAHDFCDGVLHNSEFCLFNNAHRPMTVQDTINKFSEFGYTTTNLWVDVIELSEWYGAFTDADWWDGQFPAFTGVYNPPRGAYMDMNASFKLRVSDRNFKAGVLCISFIQNPE